MHRGFIFALAVFLMLGGTVALGATTSGETQTGSFGFAGDSGDMACPGNADDCLGLVSAPTCPEDQPVEDPYAKCSVAAVRHPDPRTGASTSVHVVGQLCDDTGDCTGPDQDVVSRTGVEIDDAALVPDLNDVQDHTFEECDLFDIFVCSPELTVPGYELNAFRTAGDNEVDVWANNPSSVAVDPPAGCFTTNPIDETCNDDNGSGGGGGMENYDVPGWVHPG